MGANTDGKLFDKSFITELRKHATSFSSLDQSEAGMKWGFQHSVFRRTGQQWIRSSGDLQLQAPEPPILTRILPTSPRGPTSLLQKALIEDEVPPPGPVADNLLVSPHHISLCSGSSLAGRSDLFPTRGVPSPQTARFSRPCWVLSWNSPPNPGQPLSAGRSGRDLQGPDQHRTPLPSWPKGPYNSPVQFPSSSATFFWCARRLGTTALW